MKNRSKILGAFLWATLLACTGAAPAYAQAIGAETSVSLPAGLEGDPDVRPSAGAVPAGAAVFGVFGELKVGPDRSVKPEALDALAPSVVPNMMNGAPFAAKVATTSPTVYAWTDFKGRYTPLRQNVVSKLQSKHNVTWKVARAVTKYPSPGGARLVSGAKWNYETPVNEVRCSGWWVFRSCKVVRTVVVIGSVDFRTLADGSPYGVVTTFCDGYDGFCPDFVKNAVNIQ